MLRAVPMRVAMIGAGAMGSLVGGYLARGGMDVVFIEADAATAEALGRSGIRIEGPRGTVTLSPRVTADASEVGPVDLAIVAVKAYDTAAAVRQHAAVVGAVTTVVTFQNGLGNVEAIGEAVGADRVLGGMTTMGAHRTAPGVIRHAGEGETLVGEMAGGVSDRAERIARAMTAAGVSTRAVPDIRDRIWSKLAVNAGINALTAILRVPNGALLERADAGALLDAAVREAVAVARAHGVSIDPGAVVSHAREVARLTAANRSSMLADVAAGRRTEVDQIHGAVVRLGVEAGVPTPVCDVLAHLVRAIESGGTPGGTPAPD